MDIQTLLCGLAFKLAAVNGVPYASLIMHYELCIMNCFNSSLCAVGDSDKVPGLCYGFHLGAVVAIEVFGRLKVAETDVGVLCLAGGILHQCAVGYLLGFLYADARHLVRLAALYEVAVIEGLAVAEQEVPAVLHAAVAVHAAVVVFVAGVGGVKPVVAVVIAFSS